VAAEQAGRNTLILDLDDKASADAGYQLREAETPGLLRIGSWKLPVAMAAARSGGYDLVIIDTPRRVEPSVNAAVRAADFLVIPCRPTPVDLQATPPTVATVTLLEKPAVFVLSQTPPCGERVREARRGLRRLALPARCRSSPARPTRMHTARAWACSNSTRGGRRRRRSPSFGNG
jgi:chromosome partitioning protein